MDDLIRRQDAIDVVTAWLHKCFNPLNRSKYNEGEIDAYETALSELKEIPSAQSKQDREFIKLALRNSNGRPYYSIIYLELDGNGVGHDFEGYSSYSLDVISDYLKKYFTPTAQPEIIRCRECKFASGDSRICMKFDHSPIGELDFCAWAERRTDG